MPSNVKFILQYYVRFNMLLIFTTEENRKVRKMSGNFVDGQ